MAAAPPPLASIEGQPQPYRWPDFKRPDGTLVRMLWLPVGSGALLEEVLKGIPEWDGVEKSFAKKPVITDPNADPAIHKTWATYAGLEAIVVRGPKEKVDACADLISHALSSIPNVLVEARVVEVIESDEFALGFDFFLLNAEDHPFDPMDPVAALNPTKTVFDRGFIGSGIPPLPGIVRTGFIPNLLLELGTVKDDIQVDLLISALAQITKIDVVNAPNVTVRSGHIASITAGEDVPYFTVQVSGSNQTVSTKFKKVAVNLDVIPTVTGRDTLTLAVRLTVENITGVSTVETGGATTTNPIVSSRGVTTTMDVKDGATVVLGGLIQTRNLQIRERVPVLGDIPLLGALFSNRHSEEGRSNLLFFLRPRILSPERRDNEVILPPEEGEVIAPPDKPEPPKPDRKGSGGGEKPGKTGR